jgi:hypothetical protein
MREEYSVWRTSVLGLCQSIDERMSSLADATRSLAESSKTLLLERSPAATSSLLAEVHRTKRLSLRKVYLRSTNAIIYFSEALLSAKMRAAKIVDLASVADKIAVSIGLTSPPQFSELVVAYHPSVILHLPSAQDFLDQLGVHTTATVEGSVGVVMLVYDVQTNVSDWNVQLARHVSICDVAESPPLDPVEARRAETEIASFVDPSASYQIPLAIPLPMKPGVSFAAVGEIVEGSFATLYHVGASVPGYVQKPIEEMSLSSFRLQEPYDLGVVFSVNACEALLASVLAEYEASPSNAEFFQKDYFHKRLGKSLTVVPKSDSLVFDVPFHAKYESTTLGKDWNVDVSGVVPVACTFFNTYQVDANSKSSLVLGVEVKQTGPLRVLSTDLHAGLIGDVLKSVTSIVDDKVKEMTRDLPSISEALPMFTLPGAIGSKPRVVGQTLVMEIALNNKTG